MKPLNIKNYDSIPHLSNSKLGISDSKINEGQERILTIKQRKSDTILVFEKYDGSNVGITKLNDEIVPLLRSGYNANYSIHKQHKLFSNWVAKNESLFSDILSEGERITGEWLIQTHSINYEITNQSNPIVFFDYFDSSNNRLLFDEFKAKLNGYDLQLPRLLHRGNAIKVDALIPILNQRTDTIRSVELPEGMVYRVENGYKVDFLAKWVRNDFIAGQHFNTVKWNIPINNVYQLNYV